MEITAVVVARAGSKRIPSKSLLPLQGESLITRKIKQLLQCESIDRVVFGSDSLEMLEEARKAGAEVVKRPDFYCNEDVASANDMIHNMCTLIDTDIVVWAHCTNPLIQPATYDKAVQIFLNNYPKYDSLLSVVELREHLWDGVNPINYNPYAPKHTPARDLPPLYMQDGGIFIQRHKDMLRNSYFFGNRPYLFQVPKEEFLDINDMRDYLLAKALLE